jgi:hypothetical protein
MKLGGLDHPKVLDFASRLGIPRVQAIGHLELLWHWCASKTPRGNVGKWPDGVIAYACDWTGAPTDFIQALIDSRLLDRDSAHRLVVHDWQEHAPSWVRAALAKSRQEFVLGSVASSEPSSEATSEASSDATTEATSEPSTRARVSKPSQAKPSHTKPPKSEREFSDDDEDQGGEGRADAFDPKRDREAFEKIKTTYPKFAGRQDWITAEHYCHLRRDEGDSWESLLAGVERYAKHVRSKNSEGTQYVLSPAKFFSAADQPWKQDWPIPTSNGSPATNKPKTTVERDREELQKLMDRREAIGLGGFRDAGPGESVSQYRQAQDDEWTERKRAPVPNLNDLQSRGSA